MRTKAQRLKGETVSADGSTVADSGSLTLTVEAILPGKPGKKYALVPREDGSLYSQGIVQTGHYDDDGEIAEIGALGIDSAGCYVHSDESPAEMPRVVGEDGTAYRVQIILWPEKVETPPQRTARLSKGK